LGDIQLLGNSDSLERRAAGAFVRVHRHLGEPYRGDIPGVRAAARPPAKRA